MTFVSKIHPKVAAGAIGALASNLLAIAGVLASSGSWLEAAVALVLIDGPIVVAWAKRADPRLVPVINDVGPIVEAVLPVIVEHLEHTATPVAPAPEEAVQAAPVAPEPASAAVTPTGNIINAS